MKKKQFQHLGAAALLALAMAAMPKAGVAATVTNGGFESGLSGWTTDGSVSVAAGDVHGGSFAALLADDAAALTTALDSAVDVSGVSSFGFWGRSDAGLLSLVVLTYSDGSTSGTDVSIFDLGNSDWTYYDLSASLEAGKALSGFTIYGSSAAASLIDDVTLVTSAAAVPEPASVGLLMAGLAALGWQRRQRR